MWTDIGTKEDEEIDGFEIKKATRIDFGSKAQTRVF